MIESCLERHRIRLEEQRSGQWRPAAAFRPVGFFVVAPDIGGFDHGLDPFACEVSSDGDNTDAVRMRMISRVMPIGSGVDREIFRQCLDLSAL